MNTEPMPPGDGAIADPEIQITALLLGELPAAEASALEALIARTPELAQTRARLAVSIELTREAARSTQAGATSVGDGLRLDPARRARLLEAFQNPAAGVIPIPSAVAPDPRRTNRREWLAVAAMLMALFTISWFATRRWSQSNERTLATLFGFFGTQRPKNITMLPADVLAPDAGSTAAATEWGVTPQETPPMPKAPPAVADEFLFSIGEPPIANGPTDSSRAETRNRGGQFAKALPSEPQLAKRYGLIPAKPAGGQRPEASGVVTGLGVESRVYEREAIVSGEKASVDRPMAADKSPAPAAVSPTPFPRTPPQGGAMGGGMGGRGGNAAALGDSLRGWDDSAKSAGLDALSRGTAGGVAPIVPSQESATARVAGRAELAVHGLQEQANQTRFGIPVDANGRETLNRAQLKAQMNAKSVASTSETSTSPEPMSSSAAPVGGFAAFDDSGLVRGLAGPAAGLPGLSQSRGEDGFRQQGLARSVTDAKGARVVSDQEAAVELGFGRAPGGEAAKAESKRDAQERPQEWKESKDTTLRFRRLTSQASDPRGGVEAAEERSKNSVNPTRPGTDPAGDRPATAPQARSTPPVPQPEISAAENPFSTFSLNVSSVSFQLAAASLEKGALPDPATIRSEEFVNAFDYGDPEPRGRSPFSFSWERARTPMAHNREVLRLALKTGSTGRAASQPLNLVLLVDNSGSMERADRRRIRQECLRVLAGQLGPQDRISLVTFARTPRLWADGVTGNEAGALAERVSNLTPEGGTHLENALALAYKTAARHYQPQGINRVVLLTDGAANLGDVAPASLRQRVIEQRQQGIALDCFGIGWEGLDDDLLEQLSRNGDGRYGFLNSPEEAASNFAQQLAGALRVAASDVKVQVEFNPRRTAVYRQVGYARHQLTQAQFRDNRVDAAELGSAEAGNAVYIVQTLPAGEGPVATVRARYREPGTQNYQEMEWTVPYEGPAKPLAQAAPSLRLAATAAAFSEWLSASPHAAEVTPDTLLPLVEGIAQLRPADPRPRLLESMIRQSRSLSPK